MAPRSAGQAARISAGLSPQEEISEVLQRAEEKVLSPESHSLRVTIGDHTVELQPLPIKWAKQLAAIINPVFVEFSKMGPTNFDYAIMVKIQDGFTKALCVLGQRYGIPLNVEYIEEHLSSSDVRDVLDKQLELTKDNDFLLAALRNLLTAALRNVEVTKQLASIPTTLAMDASSGLSASPGESPSPSSSSATPGGS